MPHMKLKVHFFYSSPRTGQRPIITKLALGTGHNPSLNYNHLFS